MQEDLPRVTKWVFSVEHPNSGAGSFLKAFANAVLCADSENYELLRPVVLSMIAKYPKYLS